MDRYINSKKTNIVIKPTKEDLQYLSETQEQNPADAVKHCPRHQILGGLSVCQALQLPCKRAIKAGMCPLGYTTDTTQP